MSRKQEANLMTSINDIVWRIILTKPFDSVRPIVTRSNSYRLEGQRQPSNSNFSTIILGGKESVIYFSRLIYTTKPKTEILGKRSYRNIAASVKESKPDLAIIETKWLFSRFLHDNGFFVSPRVDFVLDINGPLENIQEKMAYGKRRRIEKMAKTNWTFEITKDPVKVQSFYHKMYLPHMFRRHGELAIPISFSEYEKLLLQGYLLLVKKDQEYVSGKLLVHQGNELRSLIIGVGNTDTKLTSGSLAAWYYAIVLGIQKGYAKLDCGETPPFMLDGGFQYKREIGAQVRPATGSSTQVFGMRFSKTSAPVRNFLSSNPFVFMDGTNLSGLIYLESLDNLHESYCIPGLSGLYVVTSDFNRSNQRDFKLRQLSPKDLLNHKIRALGLFGEACKAEGYSLYHLAL